MMTVSGHLSFLFLLMFIVIPEVKNQKKISHSLIFLLSCLIKLRIPLAVLALMY